MSDDAAIANRPLRTAEFDAFGPWIDEVHALDDVPPLFRSHPLDLAAATLALKVPRNIPRRDATPDMNLYDHLVVVAAGGLTVLSRTADDAGREGYAARTVPFADIAALRDVVSLLDGCLTVVTRDGDPVVVSYNGSARAAVTRLVETLRSATTRDAPSAAGRALLAGAPSGGDPSMSEREVGLVNDFHEIVRRDPQLRAWAWHERQGVRLRPEASSVVSRLAHLVSPMTLQGAVVAGSESALEVVSRRDWLRRGRGPEHSSGRLVIPWSRIDAVVVRPHPRYAAATSVALRLGSTHAEVVVPTGSDAQAFFAAAAQD